MKDVNSQYFSKEQVEAGELADFVTLLMKQCYGKGTNYNDIRIYPEDCGAFSVSWANVPWDHSYGGGFVYVEEDQVVMTEYMFPDNHFEYCYDEEDYKNRLDEFLKENPGWEKTSYGTWTNRKENEKFVETMKGENKMVEIKPKDLYQFLLTECRYGYTRNNHLMPDGAYRHVEEYLPELLKADKEMAINTAKQLVEECISMELVQFADGIDDDLGNRAEAFKFIEEMLNFIHNNEVHNEWKPYNYDNYLENKALDEKSRYDIYEAEYMGFDLDEKFALGKKINSKMLSKNELMTYLCTEICKSDSITYRKQELKPGYDEHFETRKDFNKKIMTKYVFDDIKKAYIVKRGDC